MALLYALTCVSMCLHCVGQEHFAPGERAGQRIALRQPRQRRGFARAAARRRQGKRLRPRRRCGKPRRVFHQNGRIAGLE